MMTGPSCALSRSLSQKGRLGPNRMGPQLGAGRACSPDTSDLGAAVHSFLGILTYRPPNFCSCLGDFGVRGSADSLAII